MRRLALIGLALACCSEPAHAQYGGGGYVPPSGGGGGGDLLAANNLSDVDDAATALANLGTLPAYRVCSTCEYTTIQAAITAADGAGGGVVKVTPGSYTEALTAAAGVHLLCDVPSSKVKACRITGTASNPAITYDIGTPGGLREDHVSLALGFVLVSGGGVGVPAVSVECPVAAAQRVELYEVDLFSASGSGQAIRATCGATGSGGLETVVRIHGEELEVKSQGGSTESVIYHSGGWLDIRGYLVLDADSGDDVALEVAAAATGAVSLADFMLTGTVQVGAAATTAVTLGQGIVSSATAAPITTNGSGALSLGVVGLWAVAAAPAACIAGAGVVVHAPTSLSNVGNCGTLIASSVNGGAGADAAGAVFASRLQQELLGTAALLDVGTGANNVVQLDGSARLPAVDGSQLTNLPSGGGGVTDTECFTPTESPAWVWNLGSRFAGGEGFSAQGSPVLNYSRCGYYTNEDQTGNANYLLLGDADVGRPASYTIITAVRIKSGAAAHWLFGSGSTLAQTYTLNLRYSGSNIIESWYGDGLLYTTSQTAAAVTTADTWHVVALRYDDGDSEVDIWVDGVSEATNESGTGATSAGGTARDFAVGRLGEFTGANNNDSDIGVIYVWESGLSDADIVTNSNRLAEEYPASAGPVYTGTAAGLDVGTAANNVVQLDGSARLPAVDGSQLTNLPGGGGGWSLAATGTEYATGDSWLGQDVYQILVDACGRPKASTSTTSTGLGANYVSDVLETRVIADNGSIYLGGTYAGGSTKLQARYDDAAGEVDVVANGNWSAYDCRVLLVYTK